MKVNNNNVGILYLKRNVLVDALYDIQKESKLVNLLMVATLPSKNLINYSLLCANVLSEENFDNQTESRIVKFDNKGRYQWFFAKEEYINNLFFKNLINISNDGK